MGVERTHYEVLGVERTASPEEVKRQYRRLAKLYHPDRANRDPAEAQRLFVLITEAYQTLIDPRRREVYDRELVLRGADAPVGARMGSGAGAPRGANPTRRADPRSAMAQMLFNARMDFNRGRLREALAACEEIVRRQPENAAAYSLMGDVHRVQGRVDDAIRMYTMAVQYNPGSKEDMAKLDALYWKSRRRSEDSADASDLLTRRILTGIGALLFLVLLLLPRFRAGGIVAGAWTDTLVFCMAGAGLLLGVLVTLTGFTGRLDEEFMSPSVRMGHNSLPVGTLVLLVSLLFFPLALLFYLVVLLMDGAPSQRMQRVVGVTVAGVLLFAVSAPAEASTQTLLFGGNVVLPCLVLGSFVGGFFRGP